MLGIESRAHAARQVHSQALTYLKRALAGHGASDL